MRFETPPHEMTPGQRLQQIAAILALGVLRLWKARRSSGTPTSAETPESAPAGLEVPAETRLSVRVG